MASSPASGRLAIREVQVGQDQFMRTTKVRYSHSVHAPGCTIPLRTVIRDQKKLGAQENLPTYNKHYRFEHQLDRHEQR